MQEEFEKIDFAATSNKVLEFLLWFGVLCPKNNLKYLKKKPIYLPSKCITMKFRNMSDLILSQLINGLESLQEWKSWGVFKEVIKKI